MNPLVIQFATLRICSSDLGISKKYYSELFNVQPIEDFENFVSFKISGTTLDISLADDKSPSSKGGTVGYWQVDDLDGTIQKAIALGGKIYRGPLKVEEVKRTIVQILDPAGNVMGFEEVFKQI